jgi:hypothetical protein
MSVYITYSNILQQRERGGKEEDSHQNFVIQRKVQTEHQVQK